MSSDGVATEIAIKRERVWQGAAVTWIVLIDGQRVGSLSNGGSLTVHLIPGIHNIVVGPPTLLTGYRSAPFSFESKAGERIELVAKATMLRPTIRRESHDAAPVRPSLADLMDKASLWRSKSWAPPAASGSPARGEPSAAAGPFGTAAPSANPGPFTPPGPPTPTTSTVIEGPRYEVPLGDETRTVDNSRSSSSTTRVVRLTREWTRTCAVDVEHVTTMRGSAGLGIHVLALKAEAERSLNKTYSTTTEDRETFEEEVTLNIAQHTKSEIMFSWKEIRQKGVVQVTGDGFEARIPYEAVVGLTFDQQQIDAP